MGLRLDTERPITASLWRYLGCFDGGRGRTDCVGVNYWGGEIRMDRSLAPQVKQRVFHGGETLAKWLIIKWLLKMDQPLYFRASPYRR
jgi:hypothetical protein